MASTITQLINNNFGGIRRKDAYFSAEKITCSDCQNVELFFTKLNSGVGVRTAKGNKAITATITKVPLNVYERTGEGFEELSDSGIITGRTLIYGIDTGEVDSDEEPIIDYYTYTRSTKDDLEVDETLYYAFKNGNSIVYTQDYKNTLNRVSQFSDEDEILGIYESIQNTESNVYIYLENDTVGKLYKIDLDAGTKTQVGGNLPKTGKCCAVTHYTATQDIFIFSNGEGLIYRIVYSANTPASGDEPAHNVGDVVTHTHTATSNPLRDRENNIVLGLGLVVLFGRLWIFNERTLWYSSQTNCEDFSTHDTTWVTNAGIIYTPKKMTAIFAYLGSLAIFYRDSSVLLEQDTTTSFKMTDESPGGCASYNALAFHGTDLFFYDDTKKGVFSFKQIVIGDKTLGDNVALDIQDELMNIKSSDLDKIRTLSIVTEDRNEIWFLIPISEEGYSTVMIFDYIRGEWVKRKCQHINGMGIVDGVLHSVGKDVYREYTGKTFAEEFIEAFYTCSMFNLGADNTMKITKFPPRVTVDGNEVNNFFVRYVKNYNYMKTPKVKEIKSKNNANVLIWDVGYYDGTQIYIPNTINAITKIPSATFKSLEITFFITDEEQLFAIKNIEFSKIKVKQV